jgi:ferrochelatase
VFYGAQRTRRAIEDGDPYPSSSGDLRARGRPAAWRGELAFQSAGRTSDPWIGPDILDVIDRLADAGETSVVVQAIGFVADHLEILYDLDLEARRAAESRGLSVTRAEMPNLAPRFIDALADIALDALRL